MNANALAYREPLPAEVSAEQACEMVSVSPIYLRTVSAETMGTKYDKFTLTLPFGCTVLGHINREFYGPNRIMHIKRITVNSELWGKGIGRRLLRASLAYAQDQGAQEVRSTVASAAMIKLREEVFGENMSFYDSPMPGARKIELPINANQAIGSLNRVWGDSEVELTDMADKSFFVVADITNLDTAGWERPVFPMTSQLLSE